MEKHNQLTRTCSSCGLIKPLAAFLQLTGNSYGSICSTCRGLEAKEKAAPKPTDEGQGITGSSKRIGAKEKIFMEKEQKRQLQDLKDLHKKETKKREEIISDKSEQATAKQKAEKEHRVNYLEAKQKQGFLNKLPPAATGQKTPPDKKWGALPPAEEQERTVELQKEEQVIQEEIKKTLTDFGVPFLDTQVGGKLKYGEAFARFMSLIGTSAPWARGKNMYSNKNAFMQSPPPQQSSTPENKDAENKEQNPLIEYIEKIWGPSSRRR